jgi:hypothetical protein
MTVAEECKFSESKQRLTFMNMTNATAHEVSSLPHDRAVASVRTTSRAVVVVVTRVLATAAWTVGNSSLVGAQRAAGGADTDVVC